MEWLQANWLPLLIVIVAAGIAIYFIIRKIISRGLRQTAIDLITYVEKTYYGEAGSKKFEEVFHRLYDCLPAYVKLFLSEAAARTLIQTVFNSIKEALHYTPSVVETSETVEVIEESK